MIPTHIFAKNASASRILTRVLIFSESSCEIHLPYGLAEVSLANTGERGSQKDALAMVHRLLNYSLKRKLFPGSPPPHDSLPLPGRLIIIFCALFR